MRILFLAHRIPYPPNKGDKIRAFHILLDLAARHEIHLATLVDDPTDLASVDVIAEKVKSLRFVRIDQPWRKPFALRAILRGKSISVTHFHSTLLQPQVDSLLSEMNFDAVFCSSSPMAEYVFRSPAFTRGRRPSLLMDFIDVDSAKWNQYATQMPWWLSWVYRYEAQALATYEQRIAAGFNSLFVVSDREREMFPGGPPPHLQALGNGVDLEYFSPPDATCDALPTHAIVFTGVMDYMPNVDAVQWFTLEVLPRIRKVVPNASFYIVGSRPVPDVQELAAMPGVTVTGFVDDVRRYVAGAALCVAPLRIARGIQNKVLEAMAMGKAVVSTPQAFEGLKAVAGKDILVAEGAIQFADAVIELLGDRDRARQLGLRARHCMELHYTWQGNLSLLQTAGL